MNRMQVASIFVARLTLAALVSGAAFAQSDLSAPIAPAASSKEATAATKALRNAELARIGSALAALQADPMLAPRVPPQTLADARDALARANSAQGNPELGPHLLYLADRKVQLARARAQTAYAQEQYQQLVAQHGTPGPASGYAAIAPTPIDTPQQEELQRNAASLHPSRDRGALRFMINDVVVLPGTITLTRDTSNGLVALSVYLRRNPQSQLLLIGHSRGEASDESIQRTAQSRADGVRNYLTHLGVSIEQISLEAKVSNDASNCDRCVDAFLDPPWATLNN